MMKKLTILLVALTASIASMGVAQAQNYDKAIGLRFGYGAAVDFKWNVSARNSWNFNLSVPAFSGFLASGAYQWNWPIGRPGRGGDGFNAYAGPAVGLGYMGIKKYRGAMFGVGAHGGVEYKFRIPFALAIDTKPMLSWVTGSDFSGVWAPALFDFAIVARYTF